MAIKVEICSFFFFLVVVASTAKHIDVKILPEPLLRPIWLSKRLTKEQPDIDERTLPEPLMQPIWLFKRLAKKQADQASVSGTAKALEFRFDEYIRPVEAFRPCRCRDNSEQLEKRRQQRGCYGARNSI
ncbi:hypothetical protein SprV_0501880200 [Sparganum proliferum]